MHLFAKRSVLLVAFALPLGACHSILGLHFADRAARNAPTEPTAQIASAAAADSETTEARARLADGQPGLAIPLFLDALSKGEPTAPAVNGLGVAYARIGRFDLARRFFEEAASLDPQDARYSANLALLTQAQDAERARALAMAALGSASHQAVAPVAVPAGRLERVSPAAVRIATVTPQPAPGTIVMVTARASASPTGSPAQPAPPARPKQWQGPAGVKRTVAIATAGAARVSGPRLLQHSVSGEVRIATLAPSRGAAAPDFARLNRTFRPVVRISLAGPAEARPRGVIRIVLPEPRPLRATELASLTLARFGGVRH